MKMIEISLKRYSVRIVLITTALAFGYAVLRYNVFGPVPWADVPIFIFNKGISLASLFLLALTYSLSPLKNMGYRFQVNYWMPENPWELLDLPMHFPI